MVKRQKWQRKKDRPQKDLLRYERKARLAGYSAVAGIDEVGRGPLAGPVVACALYLKETRFQERVDDSKRLSPRERQLAYREIEAKAIYGLGAVTEGEIDRTDIARATRRAMEKAVASLLRKLANKVALKRIFFLIDGNIKLEIPHPYKSFPRADSLSLSVACASIVAKVRRDRAMVAFDRRYPRYGFAQNKGYGTADHLSALREFGPSAIHRMSFSPMRLERVDNLLN